MVGARFQGPGRAFLENERLRVYGAFLETIVDGIGVMALGSTGLLGRPQDKADNMRIASALSRLALETDPLSRHYR